MTLREGACVAVSLDYCLEFATVRGVSDGYRDDVQGKIIRIANARDIQVYAENEKKREKMLAAGKEEIKQADFSMKFVDCLQSLDEKQVTYAFIADGRVDFRNLVKKLSERLKVSIRMQQIGSRDEAKEIGGYGICGREICCVRIGGTMRSITTEMAKAQQVAHRGAERISGLCGRLMCCLAYEADQYRELLKGMPELYSVIEISGEKGTVIEINAPAQEIKVRLTNGEYRVVGKNDLTS